jgi:hypothetical protein
MVPRAVVIVFRLVLAAASVAGAVNQFVVAVVTHFGLVNFFSYFTTLSNLFGSVVFVVGAVLLWRAEPGPTGQSAEVAPAVRGASVIYLVFVGVVFNTLLVGANLGGLAVWVNVVHHMVMPVAVVVDWIIWPPRRPIALRTLWPWMGFVAAYVVYCLVRGAIVGFYPYPFFNPARVGGYGGVTLYCLAMLVGFVVIALLVRWSGNALSRRVTRSAPPASVGADLP